MSHKLIIAALLSAFTIGTIWSFNERQEPALERKTASIISKQEPQITDHELLFHPKEKQRYTYSFERKILIEAFDKKMPEILFHGDLMLDITRASSKGFEAVVTDQIKEFPDKKAPAIRIQVDARGEKLNIFTGKLTTEEEKQHVSIMKDLLASLIFPLETDTIGRFQVRFEKMPSEAGLIYRKKIKLAYLNTPPPTPIITSSVHWLKWDLALEVPREVKGEEATKMQQEAAGFSSLASYFIQFKRITPVDDKLAALADSLMEKDSILMSRIGSKIDDNPEFAHLKWSEISIKLRHSNKLSSSEQMKLFGDLLHLYRRGDINEEDLLNELNASIIKAGPNSSIYRQVVGTLATIGTPDAYSALLRLYNDPNNTVDGKGSILAALTTTQALIDEKTRDFLAEEMNNKNKDLAYGAAYALGSAIQNNNAKNVADAISAIQNAWNNIAQSNNTDAQLALIDAMGNSGKGEFIPSLLSVISGNYPSMVKAKAVFALRFMNENTATSVIAQNLAGNLDIEIREASVNAMKAAEWNEIFRPSLQACTKLETISRIKTSCQDVLSQKGLQVAGN